jgi:hypothetical protein
MQCKYIQDNYWNGQDQISSHFYTFCTSTIGMTGTKPSGKLKFSRD